MHFPLHPSLPSEGTTLSKLFAGRGMNVQSMQTQMAARMKAEGLEFVAHELVSNTRLAQELSAWALGKGVSLVNALYRANFVDGANLSHHDVLVNIAKSAGLAEAEARSVLEERSFRAVIDQQWSEARAIGVSGVPTFVAGRAGVVGAQPYEVLAQLVERAGAKKRG